MAPRRALTGLALMAAMLLLVVLVFAEPLRVWLATANGPAGDPAARGDAGHGSGDAEHAVTYEHERTSVVAPAVTCPPVPATSAPGASHESSAGPIANAEAASAVLAKQNALIALEDPVAARQFTLDYYRGVEERQSRFPNQNFVFALQIQYPPFLVKPPLVDSEGDLASWAAKPHQSEQLRAGAQWCASTGQTESDLSRRLCAARGEYGLVYFQHPYTSGSVDVFDHVVVGPHECGWMATPEIARPATDTGAFEYDKLASLDVPEGCTFQHFMDGVLPKITAALPVLRDPEVKLWLPSCANWPMVSNLYRHLGLDASRFVSVTSAVTARRFYSVCDVPGWNDILWRQMHRLLGAQVDRPAAERTRVIYLPRGTDAHNGRPVLNDDAVRETVRAAAAKRGLEFVVFDREAAPDVPDLLALFGRARAVVGMHGGAFYNIMFAPSGIDVVEFLPQSITFFLFHIISDMLGNRHWYLPVSDASVPVDKLSRILDRALDGGA